MIRGENFPGQVMRMKGLVGFYTTRFVEAASVEEAETLGVEIIRNDPDLLLKRQKHRLLKPPAKVFFEEIVEVAADTDRVPNKGATWFSM